MTQEQRNLLMKDLSSRLLYGVKVQVDQQGLQEYDNYWTAWDFDKEVQEVSGIYMYGVTLDCMAMVDGVIPFEFIKPYLFPMSSMTEEQALELYKLFGIKLTDSIGLDYIKINEITGITFFLHKGFDVENHLDKLIDWLLKNHFDYRGLIPKGLALDATGLNIY